MPSPQTTGYDRDFFWRIFVSFTGVSFSHKTVIIKNAITYGFCYTESMKETTIPGGTEMTVYIEESITRNLAWMAIYEDGTVQTWCDECKRKGVRDSEHDPSDVMAGWDTIPYGALCDWCLSNGRRTQWGVIRWYDLTDLPTPPAFGFACGGSQSSD